MSESYVDNIYYRFTFIYIWIDLYFPDIWYDFTIETILVLFSKSWSGSVALSALACSSCLKVNIKDKNETYRNNGVKDKYRLICIVYSILTNGLCGT